VTPAIAPTRIPPKQRDYLSQGEVIATAWHAYPVVATTSYGVWTDFPGFSFVSPFATAPYRLDPTAYTAGPWRAGWGWRGTPRTILQSDHVLVLFDADYPESVAWFEPTINRLTTLVGLDARASGGRDTPANADCAIEALLFFARALPAGAAPPSLSPLNDGGVQAEWHRGGVDVEVTFSPQESERGVYIRDKATGDEQDLPLEVAAFRAAVGDRLGGTT
jgi:hypothetical protein